MSPDDALRMVRAANPSPMTLDGTRTFVVGRRRPVVIDPGPDDPAHLDAVAAALGGATPTAILLTHAHPDHAAGAPALARRTGASVWMARGALGGEVPRTGVGRWIGDGDAVETDAGGIRALATPGHAPEHLAFVWRGGAAPGGCAAFVGDLLMGSGDTTLVAPPEGDLAAYLRSLDRLEEAGARVLYPAHGDVLREPAEALARYRRHRAERLDQVRQALRLHPDAGPEALVEAIYGELHPGLRAAARGSVEAMLRLLRDP